MIGTETETAIKIAVIAIMTRSVGGTVMIMRRTSVGTATITTGLRTGIGLGRPLRLNDLVTDIAVTGIASMTAIAERIGTVEMTGAVIDPMIGAETVAILLREEIHIPVAETETTGETVTAANAIAPLLDDLLPDGGHHHHAQHETATATNTAAATTPTAETKAALHPHRAPHQTDLIPPHRKKSAVAS